MKQLLLLIRRQVKPCYIIATYVSVLSLFSKLFSQVLYRNIFLCEEFFFSNLPCETSVVELFEKMFDDFVPLTISRKAPSLFDRVLNTPLLINFSNIYRKKIQESVDNCLWQ